MLRRTAATIGACLLACKPEPAPVSPPLVDPVPTRTEKARTIERHAVVPIDAVAVEYRLDADEVAGAGWVSPGYLNGLAAGVAVLARDAGGPRLLGALQVAITGFQPRLPDVDLSLLEEVVTGPQRSLALGNFIETHESIFESACGHSISLFRPLEGEPIEHVSARVWKTCDFDRYGLGPGVDHSPFVFVAVVLHTALDRQGGVLPLERFVLRELMGPPESVSATYVEQRELVAKIPALTKGPAPQPFEDAEPPSGVEAVTFRSVDLDLSAWYARPPGRGKAPALVYLHGGFAFSASDFALLQPFRDAGFAVLAPTLRGENGNPGSFEMFLGEVDDAAAAVRWLASRKEVDAKQIYAFGHSAGGNVASLLTLVDDLPLVHSGSAGIFLLDTDFVDLGPGGPYDVYDRLQTSVRTLLAHADEMHIPHYAWFAAPDEVTDAMLADNLEGKVRADLVFGADHHSQLPKALTRYLRCIESPTQCPRREGDDDRILRLLRDPVK